MRCVSCSRVMETDSLNPSCDRCGSAVTLVAHVPRVSRSKLEALPAGVWRYAEFLPVVGDVVSLGEGGTPLLKAPRLGEELGARNLLIKDESRNPTGSFMDRGSTVLLSLAHREGVGECSCVTTGNLGASLAAYCAKAGVKARISVHPGTDAGKLYQMLAYGARIEPSSSIPRWKSGRFLSVTAGNPFLLEGEMTTGFEIIQELGWKLPDVIVVPVGTGGHLTAIWRAIQAMETSGLVSASSCRLLGVQVRGAQSEAKGRVPLLAELEESVPYFAGEARRAVSNSGGLTLTTTTSQTIESTRLLAGTEGIFAEPSSASVVSALADAVERGVVRPSESVVCVVTGAGLKDAKSVARLARETKRVAAGDPYAFPTRKIGETKVSLLRLLGSRPTYGYDLWLKLGVDRRISTASVYQHLSELEGYSLVRKAGTTTARGRERVLYELTRRGSDFLRITHRLELPG